MCLFFFFFLFLKINLTSGVQASKRRRRKKRRVYSTYHLWSNFKVKTRINQILSFLLFFFLLRLILDSFVVVVVFSNQPTNHSFDNNNNKNDNFRLLFPFPECFFFVCFFCVYREIESKRIFHLCLYRPSQQKKKYPGLQWYREGKKLTRVSCLFCCMVIASVAGWLAGCFCEFFFVFDFFLFLILIWKFMILIRW